MSKFIGRNNELNNLKRFLKKQTSSFIVVKGRRRIGKSRLIEEFAKQNNLKLFSFIGLPPEKGITAQTQRDEFAKQLGFKNLHTEDWSDLFNLLGVKINSGEKIRKLILLDEISWMAHDDPTFQGKLKNAWDLIFKKDDNLILVICGSVSSWIEKNILSNTGFVGRISYTLTLKELSLAESSHFWSKVGGKISPYEIFKHLCITGGVPRYLEEIDFSTNAEENIKNLCFKEGGFLYDEFDRIFHDIFAKRGAMYKNILEQILVGNFEYDAIFKKLGVEKSGSITEYLLDLENAGFISRDYTWDLKSGKRAKLSKFRISDNYTRFYLKYIEPNRDIIKRNAFENRSLSSLQGWQSIMGLQFENLVLSNRNAILKLLHIKPEDVIYDNPFFQTKTKKRDGCQIDYMIQTRMNTLYVCEIKFSKNVVGTEVIKSIQEKINRLKTQKGISSRTVLIHVNGVSEEVLEQRYFSDIIDFSQLLENSFNE